MYIYTQQHITPLSLTHTQQRERESDLRLLLQQKLGSKALVVLGAFEKGRFPVVI